MNIREAKRTLNVLGSVLEDGAYANLALKDEASALVTSWVYTTLEHLFLLDYWIEKLTAGKRVQRVTKQVLRMGLSAAVFMRTPDAIVCDTCVLLMKQTGKAALAGFVNAVLRKAMADKAALEAPQGTDASSLSIRTNWPEFIVALWIETYGEAFTVAMLEHRQGDTVVRINPLITDEKTCQAKLRETFGDWTRGRIVDSALHMASAKGLVSSELFQCGAVTVQGEAAMLAAKTVEARPKMRILDACSAPGGKSAYMAGEMGNEGEVAAWDIHEHRVALINATARRMGASIVSARRQDASEYLPALAPFDAVLVDAPCSGLGVAHQKPDIRLRIKPEDIDALALRQREILDNCARYVKKGGALVYATCTVSPKENEQVAKWFSDTHEDFTPDGLSRFFPPGFPKERLALGQVQLFPHMDGTEGFFIARWTR